MDKETRRYRSPDLNELVRRSEIGIEPSVASMLGSGPIGAALRTASDVLRNVLDGRQQRIREATVESMPPADRVASLFAESVLSSDNEVSVNLFGPRPNDSIAGLQLEFMETMALGVFSIASSSDFVEDDPRFDRVFAAAVSASQAGKLLRDTLLSGSPVLPADGGFRDIPPSLLIEGERLVRAGCGRAAVNAFRRWAGAVAAATPRYRQCHIDSFDPPDACGGALVTITGTDFGSVTDAAVVFTSIGGGTTVVLGTNAQSWSDTRIVVSVPNDVGKGPVGIVTMPDSSSGAPTIAEAASQAEGELSSCFGPSALGRLQTVLTNASGAAVASPALQADRKNYFAGGPPLIRWFTANRTTLWPGAPITLSWSVEGATKIRIEPSQIGNVSHELPAITTQLDPRSGSVNVSRVPGSRAWKGAYTLRAKNRCTGQGYVNSQIPFEMVLRRGLALGGGGSRGDFQVGALRYLYDVKGFRPDVIVGTSVGAINAVDLVQGDDASGSAAARLEGVWRSLTDNSSMWNEESWLTRAKQNTQSLIRSLSLEGLLALPYAVGNGILNALELRDLVEDLNRGNLTAFFNFNPVETRMRALFDPVRASASGIRLRMVSASLETGGVIQVTEDGGIVSRETPTGARSSVVDGAMASAAMPGIVPPRRVGDHMCVDGGVRHVIPLRIAIEEMGCNEIYAINLSAPPSPQAFRQNRSFPEVITRSLLEIVFDEIAVEDLNQFRGWGDAVTVTVIAATYNIHDPLFIDPGLIDIAIAYGWMRAADAIDVDLASRRRAMELSDEITRLRATNWELAHEAAGEIKPARFGGFPIGGFAPHRRSQIRPSRNPNAVDVVRANCREINRRTVERLVLGAPTPALNVRTRWWTNWEQIFSPPLESTPWDLFVSSVPSEGDRPAEQPPPPV